MNGQHAAAYESKRSSEIPPTAFTILHVDGWLIVLNKPSGLLSVPGLGPENQECLSTRMQASYPEATIVHRLDRDTSGVLVMARTIEAHRHLSRQFELRQVSKTYIAVVEGCVDGEQGIINAPLCKDFDRPPRHKVDHHQGREAVTEWTVLQRLSDRTRLELSPRTGRSHQLRVHLQSLGHPVLGDNLYAPPESRDKADRLQLHAQCLSLIHPELEHQQT
jgi:tRNA pseudouridine32 synthase/23S rRNA pseudouridine746 synthase